MESGAIDFDFVGLMGKVDSIDITDGYEVRDMVTEIRDDIVLRRFR